jgi:hypothetical protein
MSQLHLYTFHEAVTLCKPALDASQDFYEKSLLEADRRKSDSNSVTCFKGCGACCHYGLISSSSLEAFALFVRLLGSGFSLQVLADHCGKYVEKFKAVTQELGNLPFSQSSRRSFMKAKLPCPLFVSESAIEPNKLPYSSSYAGHCGAHSIRPLICSQFNSTESPKKCFDVQAHQTNTSQIQTGELAAEQLRLFEQHHFGKSALGHLPLLLASMTTKEGLNMFLRKDKRKENCEEDPYAESTQDFYFYVELLSSLGIQLGEKDYLDLEKAQSEEEGQ